MSKNKGSIDVEFHNMFSHGNNHVLVIAIDQYEKDPLNNCISDAQKFVKVLTTQYRFFEEERVVFLDNSNATRKNIIYTLRRLADAIIEGDNLLIYYSGHGAMDPKDEEGFWWTSGCDADNYLVEGLPNHELIRYLRQIKKARHILLVVDACFAGTLFVTKSPLASVPNESIRSRWAITSGGKKEIVSDGLPGKSSPFAEKLIQLLYEYPHERLTIGDLVLRLKPSVANNSTQNPMGRPLQNAGDEGGEWALYRETGYSKQESQSNSINPLLYTADDFLEPFLMQVPYPIDSERFFDGNPINFRRSDPITQIPGEDGFLLPLKPFFFKHYSVSYLQQKTPEGVFVFSLEKEDKGVSATLMLRTPDGNYVKIRRSYVEASPLAGQGQIVGNRIDIGFWPLAHYNRSVHQIVMLADGDTLTRTKHRNYNLKFHTKEGHDIAPTHRRVRQDKNKHTHYLGTKYYEVNNFYDFIQVFDGEHSGMIVPKWREMGSGKKPCVIAVDLGSSHSLVAVAVGPEAPKTLKVDERCRLLTTFSEAWVTLPGMMKEAILRSLLPHTIGPQEEVGFPVRTATIEIGGLDHFSAVPILDVNIPFFQDKRLLLKDEKITTLLKWHKWNEYPGDANIIRLEGYIATLLFLAKHHVAHRQGNLDNCTLVWMYPASMDANKREILGRVWERIAKRYIGEKITIKQCNEAVAPCFHVGYQDDENLNDSVLNIDIGGESTDVAIIKNGFPIYTSSFRFAGRAVFGNGHQDAQLRNNGLLRLMWPLVSQWLEEHTGKIYNLLSALYGDDSYRNGSDALHTILLSNQEHPDVKYSRISPLLYGLNLAKLPEARLVFRFFCSAIFYHIAQIMQQLGLEWPSLINFSGMGAGIPRLLGAPFVENIAVRAFSHIYAENRKTISVSFIETPKSAAAYGAITWARYYTQTPVSDEVVLLWEGQCFGSHGPSPKVWPRYQDLGTDALDAVLKETRRFMDYFFEQEKDNISEDKMKRYKVTLENHLEEGLHQGIARSLETADQSVIIPETLFFNPLTGALQALMSSLADEVGAPSLYF